jgi:hypothetical protein
LDARGALVNKLRTDEEADSRVKEDIKGARKRTRRRSGSNDRFDPQVATRAFNNIKRNC